MAGQSLHRKRRSFGHTTALCHARRVITLKVGGHLETEQKSGFANIPAPRDANKSKESVLQNLFSIGTQVDRPKSFSLLGSYAARYLESHP
jgi:hypothetical protein